MSTHTVRLVDATRALIAVATVADEGDHFAGTVDLSAAAPAVRAVFAEYEDIVNGQMFSFLDDVEAKVARLGLRAEFGTGPGVPVKDLQVYPTSGELSFKLAPVALRGPV